MLRKKRIWRRLSLFSIAGIIALSAISFYPTNNSDAASIPFFGFDRSIGEGYSIENPTAIAQDSQGNYFIRDGRFHIKKLSESGELIKYIGCRGKLDGCFESAVGYSGIAVDSQDNVWAVDYSNSFIHKFDNDGNFLLRIGKAGGGYETTDGGLRNPSGIAIDANDNVYVAEMGNHRIQKFNSSGQFVWKVGGLTSSTLDGRFNAPRHIAVNSQGVVYVADTGNRRIQKFSSDGVFLSKFGASQAGTTSCNGTQSFNAIKGIAIDANDILYVANDSNILAGSSCRYLNMYNTSNTWIGESPVNNTDAFTNQFINASGNIMSVQPIADVRYRINEYNVLNGSLIRSFGEGNQPGEFHSQTAMDEDVDGNLYVLDAAEKLNTGNNRIQKFDSGGNYIMSFTLPLTGTHSLEYAYDIAVAPNGNILVSDDSTSTKKIVTFDATGTVLSSFTRPSTGAGAFTYGAGYLETDDQGAIYASGTSTNLMHKFAPDGTLLFTFSSLVPQGAKAPSYVYNSIFNSEENQLYVSHSEGVSVFTPEGTLVRFMPTLKIPYPRDGTTKDIMGQMGIDHLGNIYLPNECGIAVFSNEGRYMNTFGSLMTCYRPTATSTASRDYHLYVSPQSGDIMINGDFDRIDVYKINSYAYSPSVPQQVTAQQAESGVLSVSWQAPASDGGNSIYGYYLEYRPAGSTAWLPYKHTSSQTKIPPTTRSVQINVPRGGYEIRLSAANDAGPSDYVSIDNIAINATYGLTDYHPLAADSVFGAVAYDSAGEMYVYNYELCQIQHFNPTNNVLTPVYGSCDWESPDYLPGDHMVIGPDDRIYFTKNTWDVDTAIVILETDGTVVSTFNSVGPNGETLKTAYRLAFDSEQNLYLADGLAGVKKYDKNGTFLAVIAPELLDVTSVAFDKNDNMFVMNNDTSDPLLYGIHKYDSEGNKLLTFGTRGSGVDQFYSTPFMVVDGVGNVVLADTSNRRIQTFDNQGVYLDQFGRSVSFNEPFSEWPIGIFHGFYALEITPGGELLIGNSPSASFPGYALFSTNSEPASTPSSPRNVSAAPSNGGVAVQWSAPATTGTSAILKYLVAYRVTGTSVWTEEDTTTPVLSTHIPNLANGSYDIRVTAVNSGGSGIPTIVTVTLNEEPAPGTDEEDTSVPPPAANDPDAEIIPTHTSNEEGSTPSPTNTDDTTQEPSEDSLATSEITTKPSTSNGSAGNNNPSSGEISETESNENTEVLGTIVKTAATVGAAGVASGAAFWGIVFMRRRKKEKNEQQ